jgi:hypothetical protein
MECIQAEVCNCLKSCSCQNGYECCTENSSKPTLGICVEKGCCDGKRGLPSKKCRNSGNCQNKKTQLYSSDQKNEIINKENYEDDNTEKTYNKSFIILVILIIIFGSIFLFLNFRKNQKQIL